MRTIEGQVFIRTKGAETIKLSLVDVMIFDEKLVSEHLDKKRTQAKPFEDYLRPIEKAACDAFQKAESSANSAQSNLFRDTSNNILLGAFWVRENQAKIAKERWDELRRMFVFLHSSFFLFQGLPDPLQTTKTDADGKFTFKVPNGSYVFVAKSSRNAGADIIGGRSFPKTEFYKWLVRVKVAADMKVMLANDNLSSSGSVDSLISTEDSEELVRYEGFNIDAVAAFVENDNRVRVAVENAKQEAARQAQIAWTAKVEMARKAKIEDEREAQLQIFWKNPKAAQQKAIELFPDVGMAGSLLNKEFVVRVKRYQTEKKEFFAEPDWPVRLAKECSEALAAKPEAK